MTSPRAEGYYRIKLRSSGDKLIAEWFDGQWWRTAESEALDPRDVTVISTRIKDND